MQVLIYPKAILDRGHFFLSMQGFLLWCNRQAAWPDLAGCVRFLQAFCRRCPALLERGLRFCRIDVQVSGCNICPGILSFIFYFFYLYLKSRTGRRSLHGKTRNFFLCHGWRGAAAMLVMRNI